MSEIKIYHANALDVLREIPSESVDSVVTDPPSGVSMMVPFKTSSDDRLIGFDSNLGKLRHNFQTLHSVNMRLRDAFEIQIGPVLKEVGRVMKPGSYGVFWGFPRSAHWLSWMLEESGLSVIDVIIRMLRRRRPKSPLVDNMYSTQLTQESEHWVLVRKPGESTAGKTRDKYGTGFMDVIKEGERMTHVWSNHPRHGVESKHPTEKPVDLMRDFVRLVTPDGGVVLDPFMGSGSTGVAAAIEGRGFIGVEQEFGYFKMAEERISKFNKPDTETIIVD